MILEWLTEPAGARGMGRSTDVAIIGAGIAGLALAVALQERKISTVLLDGRRSVDTTPRGLTLQPNGMEALDKLGVLDKTRKTGSQASVFEIRSWNGELLLEADYGLLDHPHNYLLTVNSSELDVLLRYMVEKTGAEFVWGARFQDLVRNDGRVEGVTFETNGETDQITASVVVGADGPQSRVRDAIGSKTEAHKYPDAFLVGLVGPVEGLEGRARQYQHPRKMLGIMPMGPATYLHHCVGPRSFEEVKRLGLDQFRAEVTEAAPEMEDALRSVEAWARFAYFMPSRIRVERWVDNGVALLGDSAHTVHPHSGQGLNLSLQDALVLAEVIENCVKTGDFSAKALREYQSKRELYADVIGRHAHYAATYALSQHWLVRWLNRRALRKLQKNQKLLKQALELTAGVFEKKPGLFTLARIGGILP